MGRLSMTRPQARRFLLAHQGLWPPHALRGKAGVLEYIRRVGCIQFDPLNVVGSSPELTLQARVADFRPAMLQTLLYQDRQLLDGWDKNMSIYLLEDWPYWGRRRAAALRRLGDDSQPAAAILDQVRQEIEERGPLSSLELDFDEAVDWPWGPTRLARAALDSLYAWDELIIHHRVHTRKVYDLARRHIPHDLLTASDPNETKAAYQDWRVLRRIGGVGLLWDKTGAWMGMSDVDGRERTATLARLVQRGDLLEVAVEGVNALLYMRSEDQPLLESAQDDDGPLPQAAILAPLDNLLWDRRLVETLFGFDYVWEVYKPAHQRRYGYYVLPILYGDRFVARFEPVRDKEDGHLVIKNWWWEPDVNPAPGIGPALARCLDRFAGFAGAHGLRITETALAALGDLAPHVLPGGCCPHP